MIVAVDGTVLHEDDTDVGLDPHQRLVVAILQRAILDARNPAVPKPIRTSATTFLADSAAFRFWCAIAGIPAELVQRRLTGGLPVVRREIVSMNRDGVDQLGQTVARRAQLGPGQ